MSRCVLDKKDVQLSVFNVLEDSKDIKTDYVPEFGSLIGSGNPNGEALVDKAIVKVLSTT